MQEPLFEHFYEYLYDINKKLRLKNLKIEAIYRTDDDCMLRLKENGEILHWVAGIDYFRMIKILKIIREIVS